MKQASFKQNVSVQTAPYYPSYQYGPPPYPGFGSVLPAQQPLDWRDYFVSRLSLSDWLTPKLFPDYDRGIGQLHVWCYLFGSRKLHLFEESTPT